MYNCKQHGKLENEWCNECQTINDCDHKDQTSSRLKDMYYESNKGYHYTTLRIQHCETCGEIKNVDWD